MTRERKMGNGSSRYARTEAQNASNKKEDPIRARLYNARREPGRKAGDKMPKKKETKKLMGMHDGGKLAEERY